MAKKKGKPSGTTATVPHINRRDVIFQVREPLGDSEKDQRIKDLLLQLQDQDELRIEAKDTQAAYRKKLKELKDTIGESRKAIKEGAPVDTECEEVKDFKKETVTIKRKDNGKVVETRPLTEEDRQLALGGKDDPEDDDDNEQPDDEQVAHA